MWYLCWIKWHWDRFFSEYLGFFLLWLVPQVLYRSRQLHRSLSEGRKEEAWEHYRMRHNSVNTGWGISRLTPLYPKAGSKMAAFNMAAVAPMSRISCSFTPNYYIPRARCVRQAVHVDRLMHHPV
jgi:hypothetical protein